MTGRWRNLDGKTRTLVQTLAVVVFMAGMGWAAVPLYDLFCKVTGYGGTTQVGTSAGDVILDRTIRVRFDGSIAAGFEWDFRPVERVMELRIGETGIAYYEAYNPTDHAIAGTASYNVTPYAAGAYFIKIACFCFTQQVLQAGERVQMPVTFYVDPALVDDPEARSIHEITLSYTFHHSDLPTTAVGETAGGTQTTN